MQAERKEEGKMTCKTCKRETYPKKPYWIKIGCNPCQTLCSACNFCGRLHSKDGEGIEDDLRHPYFIVNEQLIVIGDYGEPIMPC